MRAAVKCAVALTSLLMMIASALGVQIPSTSSDFDVTAVVNGNNQFAFDLYDALAQERDENLLFSPYSISTALAMTYAGARGNTAAEMAEVLHFTLPQQRLHPTFGEIISDLNHSQREGYELNVANRLWGQQGYPFATQFLDTTREHYGAQLAEVDFFGNTEQARQTINGWVEEQTQGKIPELIPKNVLGPTTRLTLTNAIYFKGNWEREFNEDWTQMSPFMVTPDEELSVPMMHQVSRFRYAALPEFQILEMPYAGEDVSMLAVLPNELDGLTELEEWLTVETLDESINRLQPREVSVHMPKFEITSDFRLADLLTSMGMPEAFSNWADFSGMNDGIEGLKIESVIHEAFLELNEEGTEAAAATAVGVGRTTSIRLPPPVFRADHPFTFFIRDNQTGSILFMGRVVEPDVTPLEPRDPLPLKPVLLLKPPIPEPSTLVLLGMGALGLAARVWRRRKWA